MSENTAADDCPDPCPCDAPYCRQRDERSEWEAKQARKQTAVTASPDEAQIKLAVRALKAASGMSSDQAVLAYLELRALGFDVVQRIVEYEPEPQPTSDDEKLYHWRCPVCGTNDGPLPMGDWHCFVCDEPVELELGAAV